MIKRYRKKEIAAIWEDKRKLELWQRTELAVLEAKANLGKIPRKIYERIRDVLLAAEIDLDWWYARDAEINHDLNAFLDERLRYLDIELQAYFHEDLTSYDNEEPAFAEMLRQSVAIVEQASTDFQNVLITLALRYRYTPMNGRTHGQEAKVQSFGKRCLTWLQDLRQAHQQLMSAAENLKLSKLSGAIGNYGNLDPEVELEALKIMGLKPYYGSTQIMPRILYSPLADALSDLVELLNKIALDIRLGARSGNPIYQEPFGKKQKGSSAMPNKKNTITPEQIEGMARMAVCYAFGIKLNIATWEERAIEQSCVERVFWPDLFHVTVHSLQAMTRVLKGLKVYSDNMMREIINSRGCYASEGAKSFLKRHGIDAETAYRIVQLAAFNVHEPSGFALKLRGNPPQSMAEIDSVFEQFQQLPPVEQISIQSLIAEGKLRVSGELEASSEEVAQWNSLLNRMFGQLEMPLQTQITEEWNRIFLPSEALKGEDTLYREILAV
jgi:adenylosuccinate lyase